MKNIGCEQDATAEKDTEKMSIKFGTIPKEVESNHAIWQ